MVGVVFELVLRLERRAPDAVGRLIQVPDALPSGGHVKLEKGKGSSSSIAIAFK